MLTDNKYLAVQNLGLVQRQAGVDPEIADLVCAFARLRTDAGRPLDFYEEDPSVEKMSRQFCHAWFVEKNADTDPRLLSFLTSYGSTMASRRLPIVYSVGHLAHKLRVSEARLRWMSRNQRKLYREFRIPKANGKERVICAPEDQLLTFQNWILRHILNRGKVHKYACGFVRGKSILDNARPHIGRKGRRCGCHGNRHQCGGIGHSIPHLRGGETRGGDHERLVFMEQPNVRSGTRQHAGCRV